MDVLNFNLLPVSKKEEIKKEQIYLIFGGILKSLFLILFFGLVVLLSAYFSLEFLSSAQQKEIEKTKKNKAMKDVLLLDSNILAINSIINNVYNTQQKIIYLAPIIEKIIYLIPPDGVYLTEINIEKKIEGQQTNTSSNQPSSAAPTPTEKSSSQTPMPTDQSSQQQGNEEYYEIKILGFAPKRQQVIQFKENLEREKTFPVVISPLKNILKSKKIEFEFTIKKTI